jgi:N utilization substance protein B
MVAEAIELTQKAINRIGVAVEIPEMIQLANQADVRAYAIEILQAIHRRQVEIDEILVKSLKDWQIDRLPRIDRDILRIAVAEMAFLEIPDRVAINEAIELAKRYSDEEGHRFVNGVLRRVTTCIKEPEPPALEKFV